MTEHILTISKGSVLSEVYKQTAYVGAKMTQADGTNAYDNIYATGDDAAMLERFWKEAIAFTTGNIKLYLTDWAIESTNNQVGEQWEQPVLPTLVDLAEVLTITLNLPDRFDATQRMSINTSLYSYIVNYMTSRWMAITNKPEAEYYEKYATTSMNDILKKIFSKTKPVRPTT